MLLACIVQFWNTAVAPPKIKSTVPSTKQSLKYCLNPSPEAYKVSWLPKILQLETTTLSATTDKAMAWPTGPAAFSIVKLAATKSLASTKTVGVIKVLFLPKLIFPK